MPKRNILLLSLITAISLVAWLARDHGGQARQIGEVLGAIERGYVDSVDPDRLARAALDGIIAQLDAHSAIVDGAARRELEATLDQEFGGVGLELTAGPGGVVVHAPIAGGPAWRAGIAAGDVITTIDGAATRGLSVRDAVAILRGDVGSPVSLGLHRTAGPGIDGARGGDEHRTVTLVREVVRTESVLGDRRRPDGAWDWFVEGEPGVGIVRITSFGERTAAELDAALTTIAATPAVRGLVIDLRGNPGGLLAAAVDVCDRFLDEGLIVATRRRGAGREQVLDRRLAAPGAVLAGLPIAVLVDGLTASAAEIVAACLQDHGRALVVGSRSFGKGTVQSIMPLSDGRRLLKLTTAEYMRPRAGLEPAEQAAWCVAPDAGREVDITAQARAVLETWRRRRDQPGAGLAAGDSAAELPRHADPVLARALESFSSPTADFGGQEEAASNADEAAATGAATGLGDGRGR